MTSPLAPELDELTSIAESASSPSDAVLRALAAAPPRTPGPSGVVVGAVLAARFELLAERGRGGFGVVFEALDRVTGARVAVKVLSRLDGQALYLFKHEFRALAGLAHPNLARLFELHADGDRWFLAMELVDGVPFLAHVTAEPDPERLREALVQLAAGLSALHDAGLVHRDVKPSNVLCTRDGRVVLLDFGLAQAAQSSSDEGLRFGTPRYMSPEQAAGEPLSPASDWYAVGLMLQESLARIGAAAPDPYEGLRSLAQDLQRRDPRDRPDGAEVLSRLRSRPLRRPGFGANESTHRDALVGRANELHALEEAFARAQSGATAVVLCRGESGVGKSALIRRFLEGLDACATVLANRCYEYEQIPFKAVDGILDALSRALRLLPDDDARALVPDDAALLAAQFPVLARVPAIAAAPHRVALDPSQARRASFAALRELLARLARRGPLVLVIDDLQWGDADSASLLSEVLQPPHAPGLLLCGAFRGDSEVDGALVSTLRGLASASVVDVRPLAADDALALARALVAAEGGSVDGERAEVAAREAGGNPFLLRELARHVEAARAPSLGELTSAWVSALTPEARELLEVVCLAGSPIERTAVRRAIFHDAARAPASEEPRALAELRSRRLLAIQWVNEVELLAPFHDRLRESVSGALDADARRSQSRRLAESLESSGAEPERLMFHFGQAGDGAAVARYGLAAAESAQAALAFGRAADLYRTVLEQGMLGAQESRQVRMARARMLSNDGRAGLAADVWLEAARATESPEESVRCRQAAVEQLLVAGYGERGRAELGELLRGLGVWMPRGAVDALASYAVSRARLALRGLEHVERTEADVDALTLARIDALRVAARGFFFLDPFVYLSLQARFLQAALDAGEPRRVAWALADEAFFVCAGGTRTAAKSDALLSRSTELVDRIGDVDGQVRNLLYRALAASNRLDGNAAIELLQRADAHAPGRAPGLSWEYDYGRMIEASSLFTMGEFRRLVTRAQSYPRGAREGGNLHSESTIRLLVERAEAIVTGRMSTLAPWIDQAIAGTTSSAQSGELYDRTNAGLSVALHLDRLEDAERIVEKQWNRIRRAGLFFIQQVRMTLHMQRGLVVLGLAARDPAHAARRLRVAEASVKALAQEQAPWADAHACVLQAGIARIRGRSDDALAHLVEAERRFSAAGLNTSALCARRRRGEWLANDEGAALMRGADEALRAQGIADPDRVAAMLVSTF